MQQKKSNKLLNIFQYSLYFRYHHAVFPGFPDFLVGNISEVFFIPKDSLDSFANDCHDIILQFSYSHTPRP